MSEQEAGKVPEAKERFSWNKFWIKLTSRKLFIVLLIGGFVGLCFYLKVDTVVTIIFSGGFIFVSVIFMIGDPLEQALSLAVSKMELKINNTITTNVQSTINAAGVKNG